MEAPNREASAQRSGGGDGTAAQEPTGLPLAGRAEQDAEHSKLPHLWAERPWPLRIVLATVGPAVFGALCGWVLGVSEVGYIILAIPVAMVLQVVVGLEHRNRAEAAARGFVAGGFFGGFVLIVNQVLIDTEPKFHLEDPVWQLAIVTAVFGAVLSWLGAGLRGQLEKPGRYVELSRLTPAEFVGMGSSVVLFGSLFLPWFSTSDENVNAAINGERGDFNAWETFGTFDVLLVSACVAPFILAWIIARQHTLTWNPGEVTMIVGITYFVFILCSGIVLGKPGEPDSEISFAIGYFVGLLASLGIAAGGLVRQAFYARVRKPPGVL